MKNKVSPTRIPINISPKKQKSFVPGTKLRKRVSQEHFELKAKNKTGELKYE